MTMMDMMEMMDMGNGTTPSKNVCPMIMTFHAGHCERVLWKSWVAASVTDFTLSALAIVAMAFIYEVLKFIRELQLRNASIKARERRQAMKAKELSDGSCQNMAVSSGNGLNWKKNMFNKVHITQSLINLVQITLSYILMLIFMLFNYYLCLAVLIGLGLGYFCFGWIKREVEETDCCH